MSAPTPDRAALAERLREIADIAHAGGSRGMSEADALVAVRKMTLPYWRPADRSHETILQDTVTEAAEWLLRVKAGRQSYTVREVIAAGCTLAAAALAAPAPVPPSVAEARGRWSDAMCDLVLAMTAGATDDRDAIPGDYEAALQGLEAARDDLLAAVRAETVAEAVRAVGALPRYVLNLNLRQRTAPTMDPAANGAWVGQTEAVNALYALAALRSPEVHP